MKSHYVGLWLLLVVALIVFVGYSFVDGEVSLFGKSLKKAPFADMLLKEEAADKVDTALLEKEAEVVVIPTDSSSQTILLIGDSMTFNIALRMAQYAKQNGHTLHAVNWDSSNTKIWAESDTLDYFIRKLDPSIVFISLGSNELYFKNPESRRPFIEAIVEKIGSRPYVWIGPPNWKKDSGINDIIENTVRPKSFFRTDGMELARKRDKIHPTRNATSLWVDSIMRWIPESSHPFVVDTPSDSIGRGNPHIVFLKPHSK